MTILKEEYVPRQKRASISRIEYDSTPYVHIQCNGNQILCTNIECDILPGLEYSLDLINWYEINEYNIIYDKVEFSDNIWFRGKNPEGTTK